MTSGVGSTSNQIRLSGLVSGMDTDALVKQMLAGDTAKIDKLNANIQIDEWKTEAYREVTSSLQKFYSTYFDPLSSLNLKSEKSFSSFATSYGTPTASNYVTVTGGAAAKAGTYCITKLVAATAATLSGGNVSKNVTGAAVTNPLDISSANNNNVFVFNFNGVTKQIKLDDSGSTTIQDYITNLQDKLDSAFGAGNIKVDGTSGHLELFTVRSTDSFSIGTAYNSGLSELFSAVPTTESPFTLSSSNNKFELTIGGVTKTVTVPLVDELGNVKTEYTSASELAAAIQRGANEAFGGTANITFSDTSGKVTYTSGETISMGKTEIDANAALGLNPSNLSSKVDLSSKISGIADGFSVDPGITGTGNDIEFSINGVYFRFNSKETSIQKIMDTVNSNTSINAIMKYDITSNSFSIKSTGTGVTDNLIVADVTGKMMETLGVSGTDKGSDASVTLSDGTEIVRSSNSFTYDGLRYEIKQDFISDTDSATSTPDPIMATISTDTTKSYEYIKGFVDKYNELIEKINSKISEKRYKDFQPLTADEKAAMTEDQIKQWETKAKSGLLKNDSILSGVLSKFRNALYDTVEGTGITLSSIGITTSSDYTRKGKLEINETKLKEALATKPEQVTKLFTNVSGTTYFDAMGNPSIRSQRYTESGIAHKFSDIIQDVIRTTTDSKGYKGTLLEKAGIVGDRSEYTNLLFKEMASFNATVAELNNRLSDKEKALYAKFTAMESALSRMNEQQSYITQMFSSGSK